MNIELVNKYWPIVLMAAFILYRYFKNKRVRKMIPELISNGAQVVDVRSEAEFLQASNPICKNIPLDELENNLHQLDKSKVVVVCCASGNRSSVAAKLLSKEGFEVYNAGSWTNL